MNDISKKSYVELKELLSRQNNILQKKNFIEKLPDKGKKLLQVQEKLVEEVRKRDEDRTQSGTNNSIAHKYISAMESLEWTGNYTLEDKQMVDSDDDSADETDVIKILSTQAGAGMYKKQYRHQKPDASLIRPEDVQTDTEPYADRLCHRDETCVKDTRQYFKPNKTVIPHPKTEAVEHHRGAHWEITAATYPDYIHGEVKPVSLAESLQLQSALTVHLKEMQDAHATDRLAAQIERLQLETQSDSAAGSTEEALLEEDELACDDEEYDGRGVVTYPVLK